MKLASLKTGGRDGTLIVANSVLTQAVRVSDIAPTIQQAIENWTDCVGKLQDVYCEIERGARPDAFPLDIAALASPFPRAYQFLDGSVYLHHMMKARKARGVPMPANYETEPLMYQGLSDRFDGPRDPMRIPDETLGLDYEPEVAVVVDDVPMGTRPADAGRHIRLLMLLNDYTLRVLTRSELPKGFGFLQSKPTSAFSPVAVTLDELGEAWDGTKLSLLILSSVNGKLIGSANAGRDMFFTYPDLIAHAARTRSLSAGTIIGAGAISNLDPTTGHACIAEAQVDEEIEFGKPRTPFLHYGDTVKIEIVDARGAQIFGAIEQRIERP